VPDLRASTDIFLRRCLAAAQAFSRIRLAGKQAEWAQLQGTDLADSARHWPGIGLLAGMAGCLALALVSVPLPQGALSPLVAAVAATIATVALTAAAHEVQLLRDAGVVALVLTLALKLALLGVLGTQSAAGVLAALLAAHPVSRLWALLLAWSLPFSAGAGGEQATALRPRPDRAGLVAAAPWCVLPLLLMLVAGGLPFLLLALLASALAFAWLRWRARQRAGGVTLDAVGAAQQIGEAAIYLGAAFGVPR
jgi:adenosylcobinamide-GDP ribazoletransferase